MLYRVLLVDMESTARISSPGTDSSPTINAHCCCIHWFGFTSCRWLDEEDASYRNGCWLGQSHWYLKGNVVIYNNWERLKASAIRNIDISLDRQIQPSKARPWRVVWAPDYHGMFGIAAMLLRKRFWSRSLLGVKQEQWTGRAHVCETRMRASTPLQLYRIARPIRIAGVWRHGYPHVPEIDRPRDYYSLTSCLWNMPGTSGIHFSRRLHQNSPLGGRSPGLSNVPVMTYLKLRVPNNITTWKRRRKVRGLRTTQGILCSCYNGTKTYERRPVTRRLCTWSRRNSSLPCI